MSGPLAWAVTGLGVLVVVATLLDVGRTLWHPSAAGRLSHLVLSATWRLGRAVGRRPWSMSGPAGVIAVIASWFTLLLAGWALVYWPHLPAAFSYSPGLDPQSRSAVLDALYVSTVALATLGLGDIVPQAGWLRLALPLQAMLGFALLTAAVSWVLQLYPALGRRRALANELHALVRTTTVEEIVGLPSPHPAAVVDRLAASLAQVRVDLSQYGETFYFADADERSSLPSVVGTLEELARRASSAGRTDLQVAARGLSALLDDLADVLRPLVGARAEDGTGRVLALYRQAHGADDVSRGPGR